MVYVRNNNSSWVLYDIVRDYQGSITHLVDDSDGTVVAEYSYDPWGRMRDPETLEIYAPGNEPSLMLGRGYTGHEHLTWFGLINMNARLYDPALGRFLSPDPYVQAPDFTQSFNRYSYCLNNPLKYTDENGEIAWFIPVIIGAVLGSYTGGVISNEGEKNPLKWDWHSAQTYGYMFAGAIVGGISGSLSASMAVSGMPMPNTLSIASGSFYYSLGTYIYSNGKTPFTVSFGFVSYDFTNGEWGSSFGRNGNKWYENMAYAFGALSNLKDISHLINKTSATLFTDNSDFISHSAITDDKGNKLMSFGPNDGNPPETMIGFAFRIRESTVDYAVHESLPVDLTINKYVFSLTRGIGGLLPYQGISINCVNMASLSLWLNGIPNIGLHPYLLYATTWAYSTGIRPEFFSFYFSKPDNK